ncbi:MAG: hypothetical protein NZ742_11410, partial [Acidobacteria bacterium]|nr:hypothetical protein [Acidobacteriota bacterium]MDW7985291.1 hypothetical protein [Acidobacteriota bacterium]
KMPRRWAWSTSHGEFTLADHYYYSRLQDFLRTRGLQVDIVSDFHRLLEYNGIVLNYPEVPFKVYEIQALRDHVQAGAVLIGLAYYQNEDGVADVLNALFGPVGLVLEADVVIDPRHYVARDPYLVVTRRVLRYSAGVRRVVFPCSCSIRLSDPAAQPIVVGEPTATASSGNAPVLAAERPWGRGRWIAIGTCVFWDNFSLGRGDNRQWAWNLLTETP